MYWMLGMTLQSSFPRKSRRDSLTSRREVSYVGWEGQLNEGLVGVYCVGSGPNPDPALHEL